MLNIRHVRSFAIALTAAILLAGWPSPADAQRRAAAVRRLPTRLVVIHHPVFVRPYPRYWRSIWWARYGAPVPWGYGYWYQRPYGYGPYPYDLESRIRIVATPREAEVFVDGYAAGTVDDFDGVFQRLRVSPGGHEITLYLEGYRTYRVSRYFRPDANHTIRHEMEPLAPGEAMEPRPAPAERPDDYDETEPARPPRRGARPAPPTEPPAERRARFGTLALRVQPPDAEVTVDGRAWRLPEGEDIVSIELPEGRHVVEVRRAGYAVYREDVLIRNGATLRVNIALTQLP